MKKKKFLFWLCFPAITILCIILQRRLEIEIPLLRFPDDAAYVIDHRYVLQFASGAFLLMYGLISIIILTVFYVRFRKLKTQIASAYVSAFTGLWIFLLRIGTDRINPWIFVFPAAVIILYCIYRKYISAETLHLISLAVFLTVALICTVPEFFITENAQTPRAVLRYIFCAGFAFLVAAQAFRFAEFISDYHEKQFENETLYNVAYADTLTGLFNRAAWDEKISLLDNAKEPYYMVSMDLDGLKTVNDRDGHEAGDRLLSSFARALRDSFAEDDFLSRIGGDEFTAVVHNSPESELMRRINRLTGKLTVLDKKEPSVNHSVSYGYAHYPEDVPEGGGAHETFLTADSRMYEMKDAHHKAQDVLSEISEESAEKNAARVVEETINALKGDVIPEAVDIRKEIKNDEKANTAKPEIAKSNAQAARSFTRAQAESWRRAGLKSLPDNDEVRRAARDNKVKKAMRALEEAQKNQEQ